MLNSITPYWLPLSALVIGAGLYVLALWLTSKGLKSNETESQVVILRIVLIAFLALQVADIILHETLTAYYDRLLLRSSLSIFAILATLIVFNVTARAFDAKLGRKRRIDGEDVAVASYHSRMASGLFLAVLIAVLTYILIEIWGFESLLEKTGFIGIVAALVVLTSTIWLPDIFYGLVLLGSSMTDEGDTIRLPESDNLYIINRLTPFYAILLDIDTNHRVIMRNSVLIRSRIENLSKRASIDGIRRQIDFKLGYPPLDRTAAPAGALLEKVDRLVASAWQRALDDPDTHINENEPFQWSLVEAGDNALRFAVFYHLAPLPDTKLTQKVRAHVRLSAHHIVRLIYEEASSRGLELATPALISMVPGATVTPAPTGNLTG